MKTDTSSRRPSWIGLAVLVVFAGLIGWAATTGDPPPKQGAARDVPPVLRFEQNGMRYTVHLPTGTEGLFDLRKDPRCLQNLVNDQPDRAARLRERLEWQLRQELGVKDVEELRATYAERVAELRALGYL